MSSRPAHREPADLVGVTSATGRPMTAVFGVAPAQRRRAEAEQPDAAAGHPVIVVEFDGHRRARDREIAVAAGEFLHREAGASRPRPGIAPPVRISSGSNEVSHSPVKKSAAAICRRPRGDDASICASSANATAGVLRGGIGVGDGAAERAPGADLEVTDVRRDKREQRHRLAPPRRPSRRARAAVPARDRRLRRRARSMLLQFVDSRDVDQVLEVRQPHREHRHQTLAARQDLGVVAEFGEHLRRLGDVSGGGRRTARPS